MITTNMEKTSTNARLSNNRNASSGRDTGEDNVWSSILNEVRSNVSIKMPGGKSVVVLGGSEVGKTTLVAKLQGTEAPKKGSGLEYAYIEIRDEYRDDSTQLSVWVVDGSPAHSNLLRFTLSEATFDNTLIILTVSMATPWTIIEDLQKWAGILHDHIDTLGMSPDRVRELRQKLVLKWGQYNEPGSDNDVISDGTGNNVGAGKLKNNNINEQQFQLPDNILTRNTGLDIVVVVTKTDVMPTLERENDYRDEHFDFIQFHIRHFCLQYGAALFYTSVKTDKNCDLLYKYLVHKLYHLPFKTPALCVEKDAVFIPSGWDNESKMSILHENLTSFRAEEYFNDIIVKPMLINNSGRKSGLTPSLGNTPNTGQQSINATTTFIGGEVEVEDEQCFLERQWNVLHSLQGSGAKGTPSPNTNTSKLNTTPKIITPTSSNAGSAGTPKKGDPTSQERVLAHFFNSLLSKKSNNTSTATTPTTTKSNLNDDRRNSESGSSRLDVAAELDSLLNSNTTSSPNSSLQHNSTSDC